MAKDKDKAVNPAAAHLKQQKQKAVKKGKAQVSAARNERLQRQDPTRLQNKVEELRDIKAAGGLRPRDEQELQKLEREVAAIRKAKGLPATWKPSNREEVDSSGPQKRKRSPSRTPSEPTDEEARKIPMPRDTPPPIPPRKSKRRAQAEAEAEADAKPVESKKTYEAAPVRRDLQAEATKAFVPAAVRRRQESKKLIEPEEADKLEQRELARQARVLASKASDEAGKEAGYAEMAAGGQGIGDLDEEEAAFQRELAEVEANEQPDKSAEQAKGIIGTIGTAIVEDYEDETYG